jgi:outer membrane protein OmpA-like peptidoglycan-associated protein
MGPNHRPTCARLLAFLLTIAASGVAYAQEPPAEPPHGSQFPQDSLRFPGDSLRLPVERLAAPVSEAKDVRFRLTADVLFAFDRAELRPQAESILRDLVVQIRKRFPGPVALQVEGHTDAIGTDAYNDALSQRRAESVRQWLAQSGGFQAGGLRATGEGKRRPVVPNQHSDGTDNPFGRQRNRRVEIAATGTSRR